MIAKHMENPIQIMKSAADNIRVLSVAMVEKAKSGHPGGAMGGADFINVLYSEFLVFDPNEPTWECRDRFFLDPGHMSPMLYSELALIGRFSLSEYSSSASGVRQLPDTRKLISPAELKTPLVRSDRDTPTLSVPPSLQKRSTPAPATQDSSVKRFTPTSLMAAFRKKYHKAQDALPDTWVWTISSCSSMPTKSSSQQRLRK